MKGPQGMETQVTASPSFAQGCEQLHMRPLAPVLSGYMNERGGLSWMFCSLFYPVQSGGEEGTQCQELLASLLLFLWLPMACAP